MTLYAGSAPAELSADRMFVYAIGCRWLSVRRMADDGYALRYQCYRFTTFSRRGLCNGVGVYSGGSRGDGGAAAPPIGLNQFLHKRKK